MQVSENLGITIKNVSWEKNSSSKFYENKNILNISCNKNSINSPLLFKQLQDAHGRI